MKSETQTKSRSSSWKHHPSSVELAMSVILERLVGLSSADQADVLELVRAWSETADDEDRESIIKTLVEILEGHPTTLRTFELDQKSRPEGLMKWTRFVGEKVRETRKARKLTQQQLAAKAGLPQSHISRIENGEHSPSHKTVTKLAKALKVSVGELDPSTEE